MPLLSTLYSFTSVKCVKSLTIDSLCHFNVLNKQMFLVTLYKILGKILYNIFTVFAWQKLLSCVIMLNSQPSQRPRAQQNTRCDNNQKRTKCAIAAFCPWYKLIAPSFLRRCLRSVSPDFFGSLRSVLENFLRRGGGISGKNLKKSENEFGLDNSASKYFFKTK